MYRIVEDDLSSHAIRELLEIHLAGMHASSPPESVYALDLQGLQRMDVTVWSVWKAEALVGVGALKDLGNGTGELKSMRTHPDHLRKGVGNALLVHLIATATNRSYSRLSLETGTSAAFEAALALYVKHGFVEGEPFADYERSHFNRFFHRKLRA